MSPAILRGIGILPMHMGWKPMSREIACTAHPTCSSRHTPHGPVVPAVLFRQESRSISSIHARCEFKNAVVSVKNTYLYG